MSNLYEAFGDIFLESLNRWLLQRGFHFQATLSLGKGDFEAFFATTIALKIAGMEKRPPEEVVRALELDLLQDASLKGWRFQSEGGFLNARPSFELIWNAFKSRDVSAIKDLNTPYGVYRIRFLMNILPIRYLSIAKEQEIPMVVDGYAMPQNLEILLAKPPFNTIEGLLMKTNVVALLLKWIETVTIEGHSAQFDQDEWQFVYALCKELDRLLKMNGI